MSHSLSRLFQPRTISVIGGGAWCRQVIEQCRKMDYAGALWPIHPSASEIGGLPAFRRIEDLPEAPDASFIGVNREATVPLAAALAARRAGGAVCFASGFLEAQAEDASGAPVQEALLKAAGEMPILGPNCYGFVNYLDGALLWPDQHGGVRVERGVAIVTQSSNIAINLTMQKRSLPLAYLATAGNQAQQGIAQIGAALLEDPRVTALGLHIEGIGDLRAFEALCHRAAELSKPVVALKVGRSDQARAAALSHTASLAGDAAGAEALLNRLGVARVKDLASFLECLKLLHLAGPLAGPQIATISCSGGEASLAADTGQELDLRFPPLNDRQRSALREVLGPRVALANPLDYHTYIWRDVAAMTRCFASMADPGVALVLLIVDFPREDRCDPADWDCVIEAAIAAAEQTGRPYAMASTLPELMPEPVAARLAAAGVVPFNGLTEALAACAAAARLSSPERAPLLLPGPGGTARLIPEGAAKKLLSEHGLRVPRAQSAELTELTEVSRAVGYPQVLKAEGLAHKTEAGGLRLNLRSAEETCDAAKEIGRERFLVEEMITTGLVELLVGILRDPAHGFLLTLGAGGTLTELMQDSATLLLPASPAQIDVALDSLRIAPLLAGYRGSRPIDRPALHRAIAALQDFAISEAEHLQEVEINPLICTATDAIAADALLRLSVRKETS